ncbi:YciI family protein [Fodinicola feengrottensis]|uniref:YciI family protein n=1 Tax=Fodinicola feengrottensis TaxID=435914 RepID=A0ABN2HBA0_9ACTN|nr:YciI family protein [Fodinicola feengrottensis]
MEYLILIYSAELTADAQAAAITAAGLTDYEVYSNDLVEAGVMRGGKRLQGTSTATTVSVRDGETLITDGPYAEAREQLGGFYVVECADLDEALKWASRCPGAGHGTIEVRPAYG